MTLNSFQGRIKKPKFHLRLNFHAEKYFGHVDTLSINNQIKKLRNSYYKQEYIEHYQLIDYDLTFIYTDKELDNLKEVSNKYLPHKSVSIPIFNSDKNRAFISYTYYPHNGKFFLYQKLMGNGK